MYKKLLLAACLVMPLLGYAADEKKTTPQQSKMATCNQDATAKNLAGDERKKFPSSCLKG